MNIDPIRHIDLIKISEFGLEGPYTSTTSHGVPYTIITNDSEYKEGEELCREETEDWAIAKFLENFEKWRAGRDPSGIVWRRYPQLQCFARKYSVSCRVAYEAPELSQNDYALSFRPAQPKRAEGLFEGVMEVL